MASAYKSAGGALKLKGGGDLGIKKKKKKKKEVQRVFEQISSITQSGEEADNASKERKDNRTPAEKAFAKVQEKRQTTRVLDKASKKHKDRVNEFNAKLDTLTEHFDIPKVSWTK